jgi:hypothetical protein
MILGFFLLFVMVIALFLTVNNKKNYSRQINYNFFIKGYNMYFFHQKEDLYQKKEENIKNKKKKI